MKKITTLFKKNPENLGRVINEIDTENLWVLTESIATRKFEGSACCIIDGKLYKRYDAKKGKQAPNGAVPCQEPDLITGHHPHWVKVDSSKNEDKYFVEAFENLEDKIDGTYELIGEKVQGNPEKIVGHKLVKHGSEVYYIEDYSFNYLKEFLESKDIEGLVFHHLTDGRMCKLRKSDFGLKR